MQPHILSRGTAAAVAARRMRNILGSVAGSWMWRTREIAILISVGFMGCWTPYGLVSLWSIFRDSRSIPPEVSLLPCMFAKSSTVYNPLIYYFFSYSFKAEVNKLRWKWPLAKFGHFPNRINDNSIYMVGIDTKTCVTQPDLPETTEIVPISTVG